jgi:hypothetical protein
MTRHKATIFQGERELLADLVVDLIEGEGGDLKFRFWEGIITLEPSQYLDPGGPYRMRLDDGRTGEFVAESYSRSTDSPVATVSFRGSGPLRR